jgi:hypothetical protein
MSRLISKNSKNITRRSFIERTGTVTAGLTIVDPLLLGFTAIHAPSAEAGPAPADAPFTAKGDRHPAVNLVYPEAAFLHAGKGGRLVDVTKPPFNAKGDGKTDDTGALIAARDFVMRSHEPAYCGRNLLKGSYILYLPDGTYLVSDTVNHNLPVLAGDGVWENYRQYWVMSDADTQNRELFPSGVREQNDSIILLGQSREKTIFRLRDNCPGFGADAAKPVLGFFRLRSGSDVNQNNVVENLTIDTGSGNPGAIGIRWNSANTGAIRNVTIRSGDGAGVAGLMCDVYCAQGLLDDVSIQGFDEGLSVSAGIWGTIPTLEHASFNNQKRIGIRVANYSRLVARDVVVTGAPTALRVESFAHGVMLDSSFQGQDGAVTAMDLVDGHLFARNIQTAGYTSALSRDGQSVIASPRVEEFVSAPTLSTEPGTQSRSLRLPIEESPKILHESDPSNWANVDDYGAVGDGVADDTLAIQKAMDSGKPAILFPKNVYVVNGTVAIPKTVRQVSFLYGCTIRTQFREEAMFCVAESSSGPLLMQQSAYNLGGVFLDHAADRTVVLEDTQTFFPHAGRSAMMMDLFLKPLKPAQYDDATNCWRLYRNATPAGEPKKLFVNNALGFAPGGPENQFAVRNVTVWCRQVNTEHFLSNFAFRNSIVWIMGFKTEAHEDARSFTVLDGTRLEALGGLFSQPGAQTVSIIMAKDSTLCITFMTLGSGPPEGLVLEDAKKETTKSIQVGACPPLSTSHGMRFIPLLINY